MCRWLARVALEPSHAASSTAITSRPTPRMATPERIRSSVVNKALERMRSGVAIRGVGREVIAVLDAACEGSSATRASHLHMLALLSACAQLIEKCLFLRHHHHHVMLR